MPQLYDLFRPIFARRRLTIDHPPRPLTFAQGEKPLLLHNSWIKMPHPYLRTAQAAQSARTIVSVDLFHHERKGVRSR
ncbi:hypothetical protein [Alloprevotella tannerae]